LRQATNRIFIAVKNSNLGSSWRDAAA